MEYNLLRTIEAQIGYPGTSSAFPQLTPFPANDFVNPGLGQISRLYSFYVPLYSNCNSSTQIKKKVDIDNLEGSGNVVENSNEDRTNFQQETEIDPQETELDPLEFNEIKRKRMGSPVQETFLHPKLIKTDKIIFSNVGGREEKDRQIEKKGKKKKNEQIRPNLHQTNKTQIPI